MFKRLACVSLIGLAALGCSKETTSSSNIKTGGIAALIDVYGDTPSTATVHVELRVGGSSSNTYVDLEGQDKLIATAGDGEPQTLKAVDPGIYEAIFTGVEEDIEFTVVLDRPDDVSAGNNSGTMPAPFDLDDPTDDLSRADDELIVSWSPESSDSMNLEIDGDCIFDFDKDVPDNGSYTVKPGAIRSTGGDEPEACRLDLTAVRTREGSADSKFDRESYFRLHQRRGQAFDSNP